MAGGGGVVGAGVVECFMEKKVEKLDGFENVSGEEAVNMAGGEMWNYNVYVVTADGAGSRDTPPSFHNRGGSGGGEAAPHQG